MEIKVPSVGESISEVTLVKWLKKDGDFVQRDEVIAEMESEKATFELSAEQAGVLKPTANEDDSLQIGDIVGAIDTSAEPPVEVAPSAQQQEAVGKDIEKTSEAPAETKPTKPAEQIKATPVAAAIISDKNVDTAKVKPSGANGRIFKQDVLAALEAPGRAPGMEAFSREDRPEKLSNLRKTVSRRLVEAKNSTAMLTTFNEVDMSRVMEIRKQYKETLSKVRNVGLGFMSFFTKACC